ncbi:glycosyl hydrolase family 28-related protein [Niallia oryzisoli]|uniref:Glycosyl hydrolase family 28-related protein n=1 Tax=Niallia oryzisoli TaxID=1737571 RepID=A0ABZ2CL54_9BACI
MLHFDRTHDPQKNPELLAQITQNYLPIKKMVQETEKLFEHTCQHHVPEIPKALLKQPRPFLEKVSERFFRIFSKPAALLAPCKTIADVDGNIFPEWKEKLDREYDQLLNQITRVVNVTDFGAVGDGKTDCTAAFRKAMGNGRVKVLVPAGVFITKGIRLPSWTYLEGAGKGITTLKLHDQAPKGTRLVTNTNHWKGNHHLIVSGLSLDWNIERLGNTTKTSTWGNHSSCLTYANVTYGWVQDVEGINPGLHCFDISSTFYSYAGDGYRARGGSKYVWLDQLSGYGFGDDGITSHHSDYVFISHSHMCDPSGRSHQKGFSNSNGIEIDDGSRNVLLVHNSTARCFGGVEIKAHQNSSAASNVQIVGHISVNDNRSYNFRHIGHHKSTDEQSKTAYNIWACGLVSIEPVYSELYKDSAPRSLVISGYQNVVINHFWSIGDSDYDFRNNPVAAIQYRARNVVLQDFTFKNFHKAGPAIKIFGGENRAEFINIQNVTTDASFSKAIEVGSGIVDIKMEDVKMESVFV